MQFNILFLNTTYFFIADRLYSLSFIGKVVKTKDKILNNERVALLPEICLRFLPFLVELYENRFMTAFINLWYA